MAKASDVILVHGAWADGSSWSKVIPLLVQADLRPTAVQLPLTSLQDDVATVKRAIALTEGPIVLVGHSYGGVVITEAGNDPKVISLVYIAAFAPEAGESAGSLGTGVEAAPLAAEVRPDAQGFLKLTEAGIREAFAQDLDESEKSILTAVQAPTAAAALGGAVSAVAWHRKSTWYLIATADRAIQPRLQKSMAARLGATTIEVGCSHAAMLAAARETASLIIDAAK
jgi:pimeloyl-ACP methyl ester carboxylesterase